MSEPFVVVIPHSLGKDEALRRIKDGVRRAKAEFAWLLALEQEEWSGDRLSFRAAALGQRAAGFIDVYDGGAARGHAAVAARALRPCGAARDRAQGPADAGETALILRSGQSLSRPHAEERRAATLSARAAPVW